jgi:hypothetical protein
VWDLLIGKTKRAHPLKNLKPLNECRSYLFEETTKRREKRRINKSKQKTARLFISEMLKHYRSLVAAKPV